MKHRGGGRTAKTPRALRIIGFGRRGTDGTVGQVVELRAWLHHPKILGDLGVLAVHSLQSANSPALAGNVIPLFSEGA